MSWKDYLYFQKSDRIAIFCLIILILTAGSVRMVVKSKNRSKEFTESGYNSDFEEFVAKLKSTEKLKEGETISLNQADTTDLKRIPGIGSTYAKRIVTHRDSLKGFTSIEQLKAIKGINSNLYKKIVSFLTLE